MLFSFLLGVGIAVPAVGIETELPGILGIYEGADPISTLIYAMVVISATEEGLKFMILRQVLYDREYFDEPYDGIMYGVSVSLGFAAIENVAYILEGGMEVGLQYGCQQIARHPSHFFRA